MGEIYRDGIRYSGGGDYREQDNLPSINGNTLIGDKNAVNLGIINDTTASSNSTYSSNKIDSEVAGEDIANAVSGASISVTDSTDANVQNLTVYGRSRISKNLATPPQAGVYNSGNGALESSNSYAYSIANVLPSTAYSISFGSVGALSAIVYYSGYPGRSTYINGESISNNTTITTPANCKYIVAETGGSSSPITPSTVGFIQIELGSTPTPYEPYGEIFSIGDSGEVDVQTCGKNLFDNANKNVFIGYIDTAIGKYVSHNNYRSVYVPIISGATYTISKIAGKTFRIATSANEPANEVLFTNTIAAHTATSITITAGNNDKYLTALIWSSANGDTLTFEELAATLQIEKNSTATAYEPYVSSSAEITTSLPYCGIPVTTGETYTDEQGQKWLADEMTVDGVVKRCYKVTFDGSADENIQIYSGSVTGADGSKAFYINLPYASVPISANVLPNIVTNYNIDTAQNGYDGTSQYGTLVYTSTDGAKLGGRIAGASTVSGVKTALASNPVTVVYELATPTTQELTSTEKSALLALRTFDSTTNLSITDNPFVDFAYLRNTDNGKAVADVAENIIERVPFIVESVSPDDLVESETRSATEAMASSNPIIGVPNIYIPSTSQTIQASNDLSRFSDQYTGSDLWTWLNQEYIINHGYMNNNGKPDWIKVGDVTSINCGTHGTYQVRVIGINQYASTYYSDISQDNVKNIAFQFITPWDTTLKFQQASYNGGTDWAEAGGCPYRGSDLYGILNYVAVMRPLSPTPHADNYAPAPSNAVLYSLPASLKTALMPKYLTMDKRYTDVNTVLTEDNGTVQISLGKVWVPTEAEVYGRSIYGSNYATNGNVQYEYFKYNPFFEGWLATPEEGNSTNFLYNTLAGVTSYAADTAHYVRPCFSVAITNESL